MMKTTARLLLSVVAVSIGVNAGAWGLVKAEVQDPKLPKVLLIGDSILGGYGFTVAKQLEGNATVDIWGNPYNQAANSWHSELKGVLSSNGPYAVIHFNIGLHGWRKGDIPEGQFESLTSKCVETIRQYAPGAKIVWASTTPILATNRPFALDPAANPVIVAHNAMAAKVMQQYGIPINDLYSLILPHLDLSHGDSCHWEGEAYVLMGEKVAKVIAEHLDLDFNVGKLNGFGNLIPVSVSISNQGGKTEPYDFALSASAGFTSEPAFFNGSVEPGKTANLIAALTPVETKTGVRFSARLVGTLDGKKLERVAQFVVLGKPCEIPYAKNPINIDGETDDWGDLSKNVPLVQLADFKRNGMGDENKWSGPDDLSAKFHAAWNEKGLYWLVIVKDDHPLGCPDGVMPYESDAVEIFLDGRSSEMQWDSNISEGTAQIVVSPALDGLKSSYHLRPKNQKIETATKRLSDGYAIEGFIPFDKAVFPAGEWKTGRTAKLAFHILDRDDPPLRGKGANADFKGLEWGATWKDLNGKKEQITFADTSGWNPLILIKTNATTYVVDNQHPQAADTNPGTREAPFKTVSAAAARAVAGDEVLVRPGVYREAVTLTNSGALGKPIVFRSEEPLKAVISGSDVLTNLQSEGLGVWSALVARQNDFGNTMLGGNPQWVYLDGAPLERADTRDRLIPGTFYQDTKASKDSWRVYVALPEGKEIRNATLEYAWREGLISPKGDQHAELPLNDIQILGFTVIHNADWFRGKPSIRITGQRWLVEGNHVLWASYIGGIDMRLSNHAVVRSNLVEWIGCQGVGGGHNVDLLMEGNTVRYNNWRSFNWGMEGGGSKWSQNIDARYRGNEFAFNFGPGLWNDGMSAGSIYEKNLCHDNTCRSIFSEINWDEVIQDNIVYNTGESGIDISNGPGMVIRRNVVFNNGIGIGLGGSYTRPNQHGQTWWLSTVARMASVPGIAPHRVTLWEAQFLKYYVAPKACLLNNCVVWDNVLFDNCRAMFETRNYCTPSPMDAFVNNFSDYNMYWGSSEKMLFNFGYTNPYNNLAAWQKASGRDEHSVVADPRDPKTKLPEWAQACRKDWDLKMRPITEVDGIRDDGVRQELFQSPMAQIAIGRMLRSPYLKAAQFADKRVRGSVFEVDGQRTLALWTTRPEERRYLRLKLGQPKITVENGYLVKQDQNLPGGNVDVLVTYNPTYLRGIGETFSESPSGVLQARVFNMAGQTVPASVAFVNEGQAPAPLKACFSASAGFTVEPASINQELAAGAKCEIPIALKPDGKVRRGTGMLRMEATLGRESIRRVAVFTIGEGDNKLPAAPGPIVIDGRLDDWGALVKERVPLATINDASQYLDGPKNGWKGPADLSARLYGAWTGKSLYLAVVVEDDQVIPYNGLQTEWKQADLSRSDALEISLDGRAPDMQWQKEVNKGCFDATISPTAQDRQPGVRVDWRTVSVKDALTATALTKTGYVVEMMIPLTAANFPAGQWEAGRPVKLSLLIFDADDSSPEASRKILGWSVSPNQKNEEDASNWATVILEK